ncbi:MULTISPECIES: hypothetical protein [Micromonospora]|uniref:Uncharacterized protein n=1 Tax=Micromonospora sicca TaxID=2202420 RepID=A0A317DRP5_9ACTN|nr:MULTISPECIES: hypothetical protein [unclassified Micromonospora]MBM0227663.1 hypothetical protein [Micromonospora sp. ATA51]PWR17368.1 hypothetical protein DKT69_00455 [Micromonospora sp. 4G51]
MAATVPEVVRDVITEVAPHELPLVEGLSRLPPDRVAGLLRRPHRPEELGFGLTEAVAALTPVVWIAVDEASRMGVKALADGVGGRLRRLFRRRSRPALPATVPHLTREQLAAVHDRVRAGASAAGLDDPAARGVADHVVARLVLEPPAAPRAER